LLRQDAACRRHPELDDGTVLMVPSALAVKMATAAQR